MMAFGEACSFKHRSHEPVSAADGRKWHLGTLLAVDRRAGQYILYDGESVKFARTVMRVPEANKTDKEALPKVRGA